jgi:hypothetical protein
MIIYIEPFWLKPRTYLDYDAVTRKNQGGFNYFILPSLVGEVLAKWLSNSMQLSEHHFVFSVRLSK